MDKAQRGKHSTTREEDREMREEKDNSSAEKEKRERLILQQNVKSWGPGGGQNTLAGYSGKKSSWRGPKSPPTKRKKCSGKKGTPKFGKKKKMSSGGKGRPSSQLTPESLRGERIRFI